MLRTAVLQNTFSVATGMGKQTKHSTSTLVFAYNADSGFFNAVTDLAHKAFSPQTYQCNLCALTYSTFRMRRDWKVFLETLEMELQFLHADELKSRYGVSGVPLPAVLKKEGAGLELLIGADSINECQTIDELKQLVRDNLSNDFLVK